MKRIVLAFAVLLAASAATPAAPQSATPADTETITVQKAADLLNALGALGLQHEELVGQGQSQKVIAVPFNFSGDTLWAIQDDIGALRKVVTGYQETVKSMQAAAEAKNGGPLKAAKEAVLGPDGNVTKPEVPSADQKALAAAIEKLFVSERPVSRLFRLKRGDLCMGAKAFPNSPDCPKDAANKISPGVISSLEPILDR